MTSASVSCAPLRIGTWNTEYARGVDKNARRLELLTGRAADVWVLTETHDDLDLSATHEAVTLREQYDTPGGRWTAVWSSLPLLESLETRDPSRCVAVRLDAGDAGDAGDVVVYGTVLPWQHDAGPDRAYPAPGWAEFARVVVEQGAEWLELRTRFPDATLVVAGDLNQNLGGPHYYGTSAGRSALRSALAGAGLACLTETDQFSPGELRHPPIDHVCAGAGRGQSFSVDVEGWEGTVDDSLVLSDHSGVLASVTRSTSPSGRSVGDP